eukprot:6193151-Pleurochrysis_carterae.AAC.1
MNSAPAARAVRRRVAVRRTISFACASSRACCAGTDGKPSAWSRSRTGGGPPSLKSALEKKRETKNVEQGGEANTVE